MNDVPNPYAAPDHGLDRHDPVDQVRGDDVTYLGFWARVLASIIDNILIGVACIPLMFILSRKTSEEVILSTYDVATMVISIGAVLLFWQFKQSTPGKMVFGARIVDAQTLGKPGFGQLLLRYVGYFPSFTVLCLGFAWVAFDRKKRGWHDLMAGTVVIVPGRRASGRVSRPLRQPH
jgi:uncharacterized RDD family membrane protein YckC